MIPHLDPAIIDLGRDRERMTERDARRQHATVDHILEAFYGPAEARREIQLLADEVGLGKTFVALAAAYAVLVAVRQRQADELCPELRKCYRAVLVVTPAGNHALAEKWHREVEALRTRCSLNAEATRWFQSKICMTSEDLAESLIRASDLRRDPEKAPCVIVCQANIFTRRVRDAGGRLQFLAASLFRWWGNKLNREERYHIVRRAGEVRGYTHWAECARRVGKGEYEVELWNFRDHEIYLSPSERARWEWPATAQRLYEQTPFTYEEVAKALSQFERTPEGASFLYDFEERLREGHSEPRGLLPFCKWAADRRGHAEWYFDGFKERLLDLYKELSVFLMRNMGRHLSLVIADEAHHWRHAQRQDCQAFRRYIAPFARRLLLLTATPFQLHRDELLEVLATTDSMEPAIGTDCVAALRVLRNRLADRLGTSEEAGRAYSREWGALAEQMARVDERFAEVFGRSQAADDPRTHEIEKHWDKLRTLDGEAREAVLQQVPGAIRPFFRRAIQLRDANLALRQAMAALVIRHRRQTEHRRYWVGKEYPPAADGRPTRPDQSQLHLAPGRLMPPQAELAQYLLMKVVAEITRGRHRTTLGMDLTGCYTTLWQSKEGSKAIEKTLEAGQENVLRILKRVTGHGHEDNPRDAKHPKVETVVAEALRLWDLGEKSLLFCFRVPTAETLYRLLSRGVDDRLKKARKALFESRGTETGEDFDPEKAMQQFRRSLTAREGSGVALFLDRVLLGWLVKMGLDVPTLTEDDYRALSVLCARAVHRDRPLFPDFDRPDRVFLHRAIEHVLARRLLGMFDRLSHRDREEAGATRELLDQVASEDWVRFRYGDHGSNPDVREEATADDRAEQVARNSLAATYQLNEEPDPLRVQLLNSAFRKRPLGNRPSVLDTLLTGPNLFVPLGEALLLLDATAHARIRRTLDVLFEVTCQGDGWTWAERGKVLDALVRAFLREDILLRLPRTVFQGEDETWSESLLRGLHQKPAGNGYREPLAERIKEFLDDLREMGPDEREAHLRYAMNPKAEAVVLVTGSSKSDRDAIFNGFNTPLLPDILICTQVGQEGIDLHRQCRHVVHYDLGWNPAAIEQRTGRADRIGSKTARERKIVHEIQGTDRLPETQLPGLEIALPYLAGTYDERMFERLRMRAQVFEILTGGDPTADQEAEAHWLDPDDEGHEDSSQFVPLPRQLLNDLRVNLEVER